MMKIIVDKEAKSILTQMCDVMLKAGGIRNLIPVQRVLACMESCSMEDGLLDEQDIQENE